MKNKSTPLIRVKEKTQANHITLGHPARNPVSIHTTSHSKTTQPNTKYKKKGIKITIPTPTIHENTQKFKKKKENKIKEEETHKIANPTKLTSGLRRATEKARRRHRRLRPYRTHRRRSLAAD